MNEKTVIYTAIFGGYDDLPKVKEKSKEIDYICFTDDRSVKSNIWNVVYVDSYMPPNMMNRLYKIKPHEFLSEYDISVYIDANIYVLNEISPVICKYMSKGELAAPIHNLRCCLYDEAIGVIEARKSSVKLVKEQMQYYKEQGFPKVYGLHEMNIILRRHNQPNVMSLMEMWWKQINTFTERDQLSFMYCCWVKGFSPCTMTESSRILNKYFYALPHKNDSVTIKSRLKVAIELFISKFIL